MVITVQFVLMGANTLARPLLLVQKRPFYGVILPVFDFLMLKLKSHDPVTAVLLVLAGCAGFQSAGAETPTPVSYNFDVRPVLASKCFACHGMDAARRKGKLRLDVAESALEKKAVVPGKVDDSKLIERILSTDPDEVMPPPDKHAEVTAAEKDLLRRWIAEGARYEPHWSFVAPVKPEVPAMPGVASAIDALVRSALEKKGWKPAVEAEKTDWLRRVTLALTGLPPSTGEIDAFLAASGEAAYAAVVDRLLHSPHYGERQAAVWCDAARYADTYGRHEDADSMVWPWRDWVIRAFNDNLPYDQFIQWQIAGDLLPHATQDQIMATAFNRLPVQSNESGSDPEEFRWDQVFDRVKTVTTAMLGLTMECARCHDHKFDPMTRNDFYRFAAYFDKVDELGLFSRYTNGIPSPSTFVYKAGEQDRHIALKNAVAQAEKEWQDARNAARPRFEEWLHHRAPPSQGRGLWAELSNAPRSGRIEAVLPRPHLYMGFDIINVKKKAYIADNNYEVVASGNATFKEAQPGKVGMALAFPSDHPKKFGFPARIAPYVRWQPFTFSFWLQMDKVPEHAVILHRSRAGMDAANRGYELTFEEGRLTATLAYFYPGNAIRIQAEEHLSFEQFRHLALSYDGSSRASGLALYADGRKLKTRVVRDNLTNDIAYRKEWGDLDNAVVADATEGITLMLGGRTLDAGLRDSFIDELRVYNIQLSEPEIATLAGVETGSDDSRWLEWFIREADVPSRAAYKKLTAARRAESEFAAGLPAMMVMAKSTGAERQTYMLNRGDFRQPGDPVDPGTPAALPQLPEGGSKDRLGLARWLTDPKNPLTSRVQVNRVWAMFFGRGLVVTPEDFGLQGQAPALPKLLDWLSSHYVESGWDTKALCREIALSKTYRQSSAPSDPKLREADPDNHFLARGPRFRLPAEQLRDVALAASGLLNPELGGASVKPYQPAGLWEDSGTQHVYEQDKGDKLYRRSLYTFWRRTCPPPVLNVFDAPTREFCRVKRDPTLTPLQALALLNDTAFLESARVLGERLVRANPSPAQDAARVELAFRELTGHSPSPKQSAAMVELLKEGREHYAASAADAAALLKASGESPLDARLPASEVAATMLMARALLNSEAFMISY